MKKIVAPFEGTVYRRELLEFARLIHMRSRILLGAAFVPAMEYAHQLAMAEEIGACTGPGSAIDEERLVARNEARFRRFCEENEIEYTIRKDHSDFALPAIRRETRFADLLLLSSAHFFDVIGNEQPNAFMKDLLRGTECPVMLLPDNPYLPGELVFAYDGTASATYAIRQFAYLFPEFTQRRTTLVYLYDKDNAGIPDESFIRELGSTHFRQFRLLQLNRRTDDFYDTWIRLMDNPWLVCGAFDRPDWSLIHSHSFATRMILKHDVPVFIAHP